MLNITGSWRASCTIALLGALSLALALTAWPTLAQQPQQETEIEVLQPLTGPPPDIEALEKELSRKLPPLPPPATAEELIEKISKRPGQAKRVKAAKSGIRQESVQSRSTLAVTLASNPWSLTITPETNSYGQHAGLYKYDDRGYIRAYFYGALVSNYYPNNSYAYFRPGQTYDFNAVNPMVYMTISVKTTGYYTINLNGYMYGNVQLKLASSKGSDSKLLEDIPQQSGWADYASVQYLSAGTHGLFFVMPSGGYVSRISVACYQC